MWDYYSYKPKKKPLDPAKQIEKLRKKNPDIQPVIIEGKLAKSWWAQAWAGFNTTNGLANQHHIGSYA